MGQCTKDLKQKAICFFGMTVYLHMSCKRMIGAEQNIVQKQKQTIINKDVFNLLAESALAFFKENNQFWIFPN